MSSLALKLSSLAFAASSLAVALSSLASDASAKEVELSSYALAPSSLAFNASAKEVNLKSLAVEKAVCEKPSRFESFENDTLLYSDEKVVLEEEKEKAVELLLLKPLSIKTFKANGGGKTSHHSGFQRVCCKIYLCLLTLCF